MTVYFGSKKISQVYLGTQNTNCLTSVPKNVKLELTENITSWTQPVLTSNNMAVAEGNIVCTASSDYGGNTGIYKIMLGSVSTATDNNYWQINNSNAAQWLQIKFPYALKITGLSVYTRPKDNYTATVSAYTSSAKTTQIGSSVNTSNAVTKYTFLSNGPGIITNTIYIYVAARSGNNNYYGLQNLQITAQKYSTTLTLKSGSKVYVPNGFESDGTTPKFDEVVIAKNITADTSAFSGLYCYNTAGWFSILNNTVSGSSLNSPSSLQGWYDTANNLIKRWNNGWQQPFSFPICRVTSDGTRITSINQVFDWYGYIGSTALVLPGVKGLKSNGFKADGTYNNIEVETKSVILNHYTYQATNQQFGLGENGSYAYKIDRYYSQPTAPTPTAWSIWHNTTDNFNYYIEADTSTGWVKNTAYDFKIVNNISTDSSFKVTSLTPASVQPSQTGRKINYIYKGSQLVYGVFITKTFYPSSELQQFTVPNGVTKLHVDCVASKGANGNSTVGGYGGRVQCDLNVTSGDILYFTVGNIPSSPNTAFYNASDIRVGGTAYSNRVIVAGGGGSGSYGNASNGNANGGAGGGTTGGQGANTPYNVGGFGGTQTSGGARGYATDTGGTTGGGYGNAGGYPLGGNGVSGPGNYSYTYSGAGGAGLYGGGSGGTYEYFGTRMAGGGGGSSYTNSSLCSNVVHTQGYRNGSGYITITRAE